MKQQKAGGKHLRVQRGGQTDLSDQGSKLGIFDSSVCLLDLHNMAHQRISHSPALQMDFESSNLAISFYVIVIRVRFGLGYSTEQSELATA